MNTQPVTEQAPAGAPSVEERAAAALFGTPKPRAAQPAPPAPQVPPVPEDAADPTTQDEQVAPEVAELPEGDTDATPDATAPTAEETFEFELDGEKWELPKKLEKAIQNNRDYTQKSQEIANQRRALEALNEQARTMRLTQEFQASVAQEMQQIAAIDSVLSTPLDPNMPENEMLRAILQRNQWKDQRDNLAKSVNQKHQGYMQEYEKAQQDFKAKALEAVTKRIPGWSDSMWASIKEHAKNDGYTDVELNAINDPRHHITLWKAQQYDQLKSKAVKTVQAVKNVKTTPSNPMPAQVKEKLAFNRALQKATDPNHRKSLVEARIGSFFAKK